MTSWLLVTGIVVIGGVLTCLVRYLSLRFAILDLPNQRSSHDNPTPRGGGLAIVGAFLLGLFLMVYFGRMPWPGFAAVLVLSSLLVAGIGFWDDLCHLSALARIAVHFLAALLLLGWGGWDGGLSLNFWVLPFPQLLLGVLLLLAVLWSLNLFNFMDGIDGLAGGEATFVAGAAGLFLILGGAESEGLLLLLLAASCLGFLLWNWPPARIFMGDVGSGFLGFVLAALALWTAVFTRHLPLECWLILPAVFLTDATVTLGRRMWRREKWYDAHRSHAYQHAAVKYRSHLRVTMAVMVINFFWLLPLSFLCVIFPGFRVTLTIIAYLPLLFLAFKFKAGLGN